MSSQENKGIISAYQKMLEDGTAFKEVDLTMHDRPDMSVATGNKQDAPIGISENPLGDVVNEHEDNVNNYTEFDSAMEQRINSLRNKMDGGGVRKTGGTIAKSPQQEIISLKKRVKKLEEALMLVMETHEKLLG